MLAVISFTKSLILAIVDEVHIHYQSFSCSSKTVGKVESDSPLPILTTKDFIRLIRMRYPADLTCIKRSDIQCEDTMQMDISGINTGTEPWQEQVRNRQRAFVKIFQRFLLTDIGIASTDTCVDISDNEIKRDQAMILAIKVLDFVEDVFQHMLPPPMHHPALGLLSLHSCLIETNTEMVNIK